MDRPLENADENRIIAIRINWRNSPDGRILKIENRIYKAGDDLPQIGDLVEAAPGQFGYISAVVLVYGANPPFIRVAVDPIEGNIRYLRSLLQHRHVWVALAHPDDIPKVESMH